MQKKEKGKSRRSREGEGPGPECGVSVSVRGERCVLWKGAKGAQIDAWLS